MQKVIPGASREAFGFLTANWQALARMSLLPFVAYALVSFWQISTMADLYRKMGSMADPQNFDPGFFGTYMRNTALTMLGSLIAMALLGILFVQIIRFQRGEPAGWYPSDSKAIKAGLLTLAYGFGIMMLTLLAYIVAVFAFAIVAAIFGAIAFAILGEAAGGAIVAVIVGVGVVVLVAALYWFGGRFMVGLPGVALGHSPDFFRDMWPLAKGEGFAVPLRILLATLLLYIPMIVVMALFGGSQVFEIFSTAATQGDNPQLMFGHLADMMEAMRPAMIVLMIIYMPFMWFMTLLLGVAFQRFRAKQTQAK
jgi:hypothetical protein